MEAMNQGTDTPRQPTPEAGEAVAAVPAGMELRPCPFCGGEAKRFTIEEPGDNFGGDVIQCMGMCGASSHVEFGRKENLVSLWNDRVTPPTPAQLVAAPEQPGREAMRDRVAGLIALAGLGTNTGEARRPHGEWKPDEFATRIMDIIPTRVVDQCFDLADVILALFPSQPAMPARVGEGERERERAWLSELLAVIHRDGGQYEDAHGTEKAVSDALLLSAERLAFAASDRASGEVERLREDDARAYFERGFLCAAAWAMTKRDGAKLSDEVIDHAWAHRDEGMDPEDMLPALATTGERADTPRASDTAGVGGEVRS